MPRTILTLAAVAALLYIALCLALFLAQRSFIYFPQTKSTGDNGTTLTLNVDGERILVATRPREGSDAVIYFGGNAEDVSHSLPTLAGRSLGSGVAIHVASERPIERLVLVTPYDSLLAIAAGQFGLFPLRWLMLDKFESWRYAPKVTAPTQLIAAQNDEVIPAASTTALYKHFSQSLATLTVIPAVGHNTISESPEYIPLLRGMR